MSFSHLVLD
jgi:hypothetical protein